MIGTLRNGHWDQGLPAHSDGA